MFSANNVKRRPTSELTSPLKPSLIISSHTPNVPIRKGKEAILLGYQETSKLNDEHCDSTIIEDVRVYGDLAVARGIDTGTTTPKGGRESARYSLKWLIVLERQSDGAWKWTHEIWNENEPLPERLTKN